MRRNCIPIGIASQRFPFRWERFLDQFEFAARRTGDLQTSLSVGGGNCKDNISKDPFSQCENLQNLQGIHIQVKSEYVGTIDNK